MKLVSVISSLVNQANRRIIKIKGMGKSDIQTCEEASPFGVDSNPIKDMIAVYSKTGEMGSTVIVGYLNKNQLADVGENRLYSTDADGLEQNYIWLKNDGDIEIGGSSDNMVRFSVLEAAFNQFKQEFNAHVHPSNGAPPTIPSTADISGAKINEIKTS